MDQAVFLLENLERLLVPLDELEKVTGDREDWASLLRLLLPLTRLRINATEENDINYFLKVLFIMRYETIGNILGGRSDGETAHTSQRERRS